jgi:DNA invertase Pin-like site-specific DNA recombinase
MTSEEDESWNQRRMTKARKIQGEQEISENRFEGREGLVYARVSTKKQELEGSGLQSQEGRCVADLLSIVVPHVETFPDSFTGGGDFTKRPAMRELLNYIDARPHKKFVVVFDDLKRLARDTQEHLKLRATFEMRGVIPRCLNYNFDDSPEGIFVETVLAAGNELERKQNQRQTVQKMKSRLELGYWPFGGKKGYDMVKDRGLGHGKIPVPNAEGLTMLTPALLAFASGKLSRKIDVCRYLVECGFWKNQTPDKYIDKLAEILQDPFYCGDIAYPKWEVSRRRGKHEGIISYETFNRIQMRLKRDEASLGIRTDRTEDFPLRGLLVCSECGNQITGAWSYGYKHAAYAYYYCQRKGCSLRSKTCPKARVEDDFKKLLKKTTLTSEAEKLVELVFESSWEEEMSDHEAQERRKVARRLELEQKLRDFSGNAIKAKNDTVRDVYEKQMEETMRELEELDTSPGLSIDLETPYRNALSKVKDMLRNPVSIWDSFDIEEKNRLFFFLFEAKLPYDKFNGYRNAESLSTARLFEEFVVENPLMCG